MTAFGRWFLAPDRAVSHYVDADGASRCGALYDHAHHQRVATRHWGVTPQCADCQQTVRDEIAQAKNSNAADGS